MAPGSRHAALHCAAVNCRNYYKDNRSSSFFRFPKDRARCAEWVSKIGRQDLKSKDPETLSNSYRLCDQHFESKFVRKGAVRCLLQSDAIPTIFLNNGSVQRDNSTCSSATSLFELSPSPNENAGTDPSHKLSQATPPVSAFNNTQPYRCTPKQHTSLHQDTQLKEVEKSATGSYDSFIQDAMKKSTPSYNVSPKICAQYQLSNATKKFSSTASSEVSISLHPLNHSPVTSRSKYTKRRQHVPAQEASVFKRKKTSAFIEVAEADSSFEGIIEEDHSITEAETNTQENRLDAVSSSATSISNETFKPGASLPDNAFADSQSSATTFATPAPKSVARSNSSTTPVAKRGLFTSSAVQTSLNLSKNTPRKLKLRKKNTSLQYKVRYSLKKNTATREIDKSINQKKKIFKNLCYELLPKKLANIIAPQAHKHTIKAKNRRYSIEEKRFALCLYYMSPKAYRFLRTIMALPCARTLNRFTEKLKFKPGYNEGVFHILKAKVDNLPPDRRQCALSADEMTLRSHLFYNRSEDSIIGLHDHGNGKSFRAATHSLVVMGRGIIKNWKQPLAYFFSNSTITAYSLKDIVFNGIRKLREIGLQVNVYISDLGSTNLELAHLLGVTETDPFFFVDGVKVIWMFDVPHLLKCIRNNLMKHTFKFGTKEANWEPLRQLYNIDKQQSLRLAPKLTDVHLDPNGFQKMKVKTAVQVLSQTVSAAIYTHVALGTLPASAKGFAEVSQKFDTLFDICNSSHHKVKKHMNAAYRNKPHQKDFLYEMLKFFANLQIINKEGENVTKDIKCIFGWKVTIRGLLDLWCILKKDGITYLFTRRLNQDIIENLFSLVRSLGGFCMRPPPIQFERAFKKITCMNYFMYSPNANCAPDLCEMLATLDNLDKIKNAPLDPFMLDDREVDEMPAIEEASEKIKTYKVGIQEYRNMKLPYENALTYVCGYLINKGLEKHTCDVCKQYARECNELLKTRYFCHFKAWNLAKGMYGALKSPPEDFIRFVKEMEEYALENLEYCIAYRPAARLVNQGLQIGYQHPCKNFPLLFVIHLFARLRIYTTCRDMNRQLAFPRKSVVPLSDGSVTKEQAHKLLSVKSL